MLTYKQIVKEILRDGLMSTNRTGVDTYSSFGRQYRYDLRNKRFPILTTRYQPFKKIVAEVLWYLRGESECSFLDDHDVKIWKAWTDKETNSIGPLYPTQFRKHLSVRIPSSTKERKYLESIGYQDKTLVGIYIKEIDQFKELITNLKENPYSRRHILNMWDHSTLPDEKLSIEENLRVGNMGLAPCLTLFQFHLRELSCIEILELEDNQSIITNLKERFTEEEFSTFVKELRINRDSLLKDYPKLKTKGLSLSLYQRSWDVGAAGGWNVSQSALLTHIVASMIGATPLEFIHTVGDIHIYEDQTKLLFEQTLKEHHELPLLVMKDLRELTIEKIEEIKVDDFKLVNYIHNGVIKIPVAT